MKAALASFLIEYPSTKAILIGTRRTDPYSLHLKPFQVTDESWPQVMRIHPILDWKYSDVWTEILDDHIPYCVLYDRGYTSLGDQNNTLPNPQLCSKEREFGYDEAWKLTNELGERDGRI